MARPTKQELLEENDELRSKLEEIHSQIEQVLELNDELDDDEEED